MRRIFKFFFYLCLIGIIALVVLSFTEQTGMLDRILPGPADKVAVIEVNGVLTQSRSIIDKLVSYRENEKVKAIVLRIDSPGGSVGPAQEIHEEVCKTRDAKVVVASLGSVAASGGYYIACAAHTIVANPGTITGSIGVIIEFANIEELLGKIGLKSVVIKSGKYKDILSPTRTLKEEERKLLQDVIDTVHGQFINAVAEGRRLPRDTVAAIADGRIFSGEQAKQLGLVDVLGNLQDAITIAGRQAGIPGKPSVIYPEKKRPSLWEFFLDSAFEKLYIHLTDHTVSARYQIEQRR
ncbi:MAG: signal peptide peptidase SppA [Desulfobacterota bacterium]|nr:signal peptide peptidase SppA [Thermodesulfobacteriota bacterium]